MVARLAPLTIKLLRDVWRLRGQALAIALVMAAGVGMVVMSYGMMRSLAATRDAYYARFALADAWVPLRRAPPVAAACSVAGSWPIRPLSRDSETMLPSVGTRALNEWPEPTARTPPPARGNHAASSSSLAL